MKLFSPFLLKQLKLLEESRKLPEMIETVDETGINCFKDFKGFYEKIILLL